MHHGRSPVMSTTMARGGKTKYTCSSSRLHQRVPLVRTFSKGFPLKDANRTRPSSLFRRAWNGYASALNSRPLMTKTAAATLIFFTSDTVTQYLTSEGDTAAFSFNPSRAASGAAFGVVATSWLHYWWGFLERVVEARLPVARYRLGNTLTKVFLDQAIGAPLYIYSYYFITNFLQKVSSQRRRLSDESIVDNTLAQNEGTPEDLEKMQEILSETHHRAVDMLLPTMPRHWKLWPLVHTVNFYFVPLHHRVLVQNVVLVGWSGCKWVSDLSLLLLCSFGTLWCTLYNVACTFFSRRFEPS